jgi:hypothetical protein
MARFAVRQIGHSPGTDADPTAATGAPDDPDVISVIWHETAAVRAAIHRGTQAGCDVVLAVGPGALDLRGHCPCRDFLVDIIAAGVAYLRAHAGSLRNPSGAVRVYVRTRAVGDWIRHRRLEKGALARTDRLRRGARARGLPDEFHRAVLEFVADEAGSMAPLHDDEHLMRRIAVRCATEFGPAGGDPARVRAAYEEVRRHCRTGPRVNVGTATCPEYVTWWERYVERPLGRRPHPDERLCTLDGNDVPAGAHDLQGSDHAVVDDVALALLSDAARRHPGDAGTALRHGVDTLVDAGLLPAREAAAVLAESGRRAAALDVLSALS